MNALANQNRLLTRTTRIRLSVMLLGHRGYQLCFWDPTIGCKAVLSEGPSACMDNTHVQRV